MDEVRGFAGSAQLTMRSLAVAACLALLITGKTRAAGTTTRTNSAALQTAHQQEIEAAKKADADLRRDAARRLITLRQLIWAEQRNAATEQLADRTDEVLLDLVEGNPASEFNSQINAIEHDVVTVRRKAAHASMTGAVSQSASSGEQLSFGTALAVLLSLGSLALSLVLYLRRRHVVEQTLRDAGLL